MLLLQIPVENLEWLVRMVREIVELAGFKLTIVLFVYLQCLSLDIYNLKLRNSDPDEPPQLPYVYSMSGVALHENMSVYLCYV